MAETAQDTPAPKDMRQAFEQAAEAHEKAAQSSEEQVTAPVQGSDSQQEPVKAKTEPVAPATKDGKPTDEQAAQMRAADYTRKTQDLARQRDELKSQVDFAEAWMPTAVAYNKASPQVQAQVKALLEGKSAPAKAGPSGTDSERINKLLDSFEEADRSTVKDLLSTFMEEAEERISRKYGELDRKIDEKSQTLEQETRIRQERDADSAWKQFDKECPEWRELSEKQVRWFQRDILEDPNIDPIKHFRDVFLPELGSRAKREATETVNKIIGRAGQAVPRANGASAQPVEKYSTMREALEATARKMGM